MKELVSPKQVARAIGVSESSLKRWCDRGLIRTIRTAGGHRKLPISSVLEFIKSSGHELVQPGLLGLPASIGQSPRTVDAAREFFLRALIAGDEQTCRRIVFDLLLADRPISEIGDEVVAPTFAEIGEKWGCGDVEVYQERRSCEICIRLFHELRTWIGPAAEDAPTAIGCTLTGDYYTLSTTLVELVLRENGWNANTYGNNLPVHTWVHAIQEQQPKLTWLSVSHIPDPVQFLQDVEDIFDAAHANDAVFVIGGRAVSESLRTRLKYDAFFESLADLSTYTSDLLVSQR